MRCPKCERPPPRDAVDGLGSMPSVAAGIDLVAPEPTSLQVRHLVQNFRLEPSRAELIAHIAYTAVRS